MELKAPWRKFYKGIPESLSYPEGSISDAVFENAREYPKAHALYYMGKRISYEELYEKTLDFQCVFESLGVKKGDVVAVCLPNIPEAVYCLYALNRMGAVSAFLHPLSAPAELDYYLQELSAKLVVTLDSLLEKFGEKARSKGRCFLLTSPSLSMPAYMKIGYRLTEKKKAKVEYGEKIKSLSELLKAPRKATVEAVKMNKDDTAVILFSGGTTGVPKGVMLSNLGLNAMGMQTAVMSGTDVRGTSMLAAMPMFHGFGLAVCIHTIMISGGCSILVPRFTAKEYAKLIKKRKPNFIAGVPTIYEAICDSNYLDRVELSFLMGVFSGGDTLSPNLKERFDEFLKAHGAKVRIREGYGATECVTASCLTPINDERRGSIGIPFPDVFYKICKVDTTDEVPYGEVGEICITGPAIMKGYLNDREETEKVLKKHEDGNVWLHTGDLGLMDTDGFVYFKQRIKRMIITSGYNVYPSRIEDIANSFEGIEKSCAVGVEDTYKMQRVKLYAVLKKGVEDTPRLREELNNYLKNNIAKYALPKEIEFIKELPKTKYGKVDFNKLQENAKTDG